MTAPAKCRKRTPVEVRLKRRLVKTSAGCIVWTGATSDFGHGVIGNGGKGEGLSRTHRVAWRIAFGEIPDGMLVLHRCDNPPCCNPEHLFLGTPADNVHDMMAKGRDKFFTNVKLSHDDVRAIRKAAADGETSPFIAKRHCVEPRQIRRIVAGTRWRHVD